MPCNSVLWRVPLRGRIGRHANSGPNDDDMMRWADEQEDISFSPYKDDFLKEYKGGCSL